MSDITNKISSIAPEEITDNASEFRREVTIEPSISPPKTGGIWGITVAMALLWAFGVAGFLYLEFIAGRDGQALMPWQWVLFGTLVIIPTLIIMLLGTMLARLVRLSAQTRHMLSRMDAISRPDESARARVDSLVSSVRSQIITVDSELKQALDRLAGMETTLKGHVSALETSHLAAVQQGNDVSERLAEERRALKDISITFDERMTSLSRMLSDHNERLSQATHTAEQKIQEARVSVEGAAAKINASSEIVKENASAASLSLETSQNQIEQLGGEIKDLAMRLDDISTQHASDLSGLLEQLRQEQDTMNASIEERLSKMRDMSLSAKVSAETLQRAADAGQSTVQALSESANLADDAVKQRFAQMEDMVRYSNARAESISERAAKRVKDALSLSRMEIGRIEEDMRALEERLEQNLDAADRRSVVDVTPKPSWRKSLLRFRPLADEAEDIADPIEDDVTPETSEPLEYPSQSVETVVSKPAAELSAEEDMADDTSEVITNSDDPSEENDVLDLNSDDITAKLDVDGNLTLGDQDITNEAAPLELSENMEVRNETEQLVTSSSDSEIIAPIQTEKPSKLRRRKKEKGWSWRNLLGGIDEKAEAETTAPKPVAETSTPEKTDVISRLEKIGLDPSAIIDDSCVLEAVNARTFKGSAKMREVVELRLPGPVAHLKQAMNENDEFKKDVQDYAVRYYQTLTNVENNRETLREALETPSGRAFILCDTALG